MTISQKPVVGQSQSVEKIPEIIPNGPGAAAILAAGIGSAAIGILALAGDASKAINGLLTFYKPSGALSGVTTVAIIIWLVAWFILARRWGNKTVAMSRVNVGAFALLLIGLLLTFPPFMDFLQGK
ncbi:hypothetical protein EN836_32465 [Mesorhizobium sp. M1C.F.Ca.ET.193.01.1.1]|uniref:hypothetical protein n=1 Tax=unclassified Mesorhizobium TaxID=325217 RepID=UPI000FD46FFE|nr:MULTISPECIES: hypothetical protein [unclassified Mesorhizobium]TGS91224.1 hypothetical protein EN820_53035 [bacterium M00.F.Ca.ET.177.01.1.1]TGQ49710.1 hypothetical protein EN853_32460 [Mesorhizobium sp. M1C.F.Ca.ET.210.01.1.1]TGQ63945.1 hypothetical protein EN855_032475 [Mesorhizobium sp. M1C.F.Ca.ET.212.01.1.1]TGQ97834.1 hypothetical protein EN847_32345 [Mesorhizobium sp. M1C.F.Ca.ET.204.01.1.1]TGR17838.1 hypothetical protein EN839_32460 [Mesorhizobium sp. M1C.F.Ca.ET.196.01.1.1]